MKYSWPKIALFVINLLIVFAFCALLYLHFVGPINIRLAGLSFSASHYSKPLLLIALLWLLKHVVRLLAKPEIGGKDMTWYYLGIGIIAGATLLLEITMTRIFAVAFFNHFAYLIISTALFGIGFSGVVLSIFPGINKLNFNKVLMVLSVLFSLCAIITLKVVIELPLQFGEEKTLGFFLRLAVYYLALAIPFFFSGMVIAMLLTQLAKHVNKLYFSDLLGAGIGCFLVIPLVPWLGAPGTVLVVAMFGIVAAACFGKLVSWRTLPVLAVILLLILALLPLRHEHFRVNVHEGKRTFTFHESRGEIEFTRWGPISRIDVADFNPDKIIWIDGGSNQSFMKPFNGDVEYLQRMEHIKRRGGIVYRLVDSPDVLAVGPAGGEEILYALAHAPKSIVGVELDPVIVELVQNEYRDFIGSIYNQPNVTLVCDEGRSYIRRSTKKYDIIQQINNASPVAIASGAVNLSETYLITVEAFHDYLDHLKPGGYIFIRRWGAIRLATVAARALRERGVAHPEEQIIIMDDPVHNFGGGQFYLKKGRFTAKELAAFKEYGDAVLYGPKALGVTHRDYAKLRELIANPDGWKVYDKAGINMYPVTDNKPFFNHFKKFARFNLDDIPPEFHPIFEKYNDSDTALLAILGEAALLSIIFIILPLVVFQRAGLREPARFKFLAYFFALGLAFILIEIALIQRFTLFMGNPSYSVTVVLFSLLVAAGVGSYISGKLRSNLKRNLLIVVVGITVAALLELFLSPIVFHMFLGYSMPVRILVSIALLTPLGLLMGMPFPLGITLVNRISKRLIPWVWGINGYATVIGSVLCVIIALAFGFKAVVFIACAIYLLGMAIVMTVKTKGESAQ